MRDAVKTEGIGYFCGGDVAFEQEGLSLVDFPPLNVF